VLRTLKSVLKHSQAAQKTERKSEIAMCDRMQMYNTNTASRLIVLIPKPGTPPHELTSYRPISLLPITSKALGKLLSKRLLPIVEKKKQFQTINLALDKDTPR
jgi:hypothetical protein